MLARPRAVINSQIKVGPDEAGKNSVFSRAKTDSGRISAEWWQEVSASITVRADS